MSAACRAVEIVCREGPARVLELAAMGAAFTKTQSGELHLTREGGHSARRIVHAADVTGREIERALLARAHAHPNIAFYEHHAAVDLVLDEASLCPCHCLACPTCLWPCLPFGEGPCKLRPGGVDGVQGCHVRMHTRRQETIGFHACRDQCLP